MILYLLHHTGHKEFLVAATSAAETLLIASFYHADL